MNFQLVLVILCLLAAVLFIARKAIGALSRKGPPSCASCPHEKTCGAQNAVRPRCSLEELRLK
ncbi:MAG: hypothetical protein HDQ44_01280 [Desulfovibrio sp.]|nr:hypothetical protein [Desulfovibrio sp.]